MNKVPQMEMPEIRFKDGWAAEILGATILCKLDTNIINPRWIMDLVEIVDDDDEFDHNFYFCLSKKDYDLADKGDRAQLYGIHKLKQGLLFVSGGDAIGLCQKLYDLFNLEGRYEK